MTGILKVIATPIGNLSDLSPRAAAALRAAPLILAEDTRRARILLEHVGGTGRPVSCHQHNELERVSVALERLRAGDDVAFVSDAGAPSVSDPGGRLVEAIAEEGLPVEVIPGPSAIIAALMGAGLDLSRFAFLGFLPRRSGARRAWIERIPRELGLVMFEAANRVADTLSALHEVLGARRVVVARELTKRFETFHRGRLGAPLAPAFVDRGEVVIVVEAESPGEGPEAAVGSLDVAGLMELRNDTTLKPKERAKALARRLGVSTQDAYRMVRGEMPLPIPASPVQPTDERGPTDTHPAPSSPTGQRPAQRAVAVSTGPREQLGAALAQAAHALLDAHGAAVACLPASVAASAFSSAAHAPGEDQEPLDTIRGLLRLAEGSPGLPAPVEVQTLARTLLAALHAYEEMQEALEWVEQTQPFAHHAPPDP